MGTVAAVDQYRCPCRVGPDTAECGARVFRPYPENPWSDGVSSTIRVNITPGDLLRFSDYLRHAYDARPELIVAEDSCAKAGGFTLRYFFELPGRNSVLI